MTQSVWKYPLKVDDRQVIEMPFGASPLKVDVQNGQPYLWALVNPAVEQVKCEIIIVGTGHPVDDFITASEYVDSFMMHDGALVFHVFLKERVV